MFQTLVSSLQCLTYISDRAERSDSRGTILILLTRHILGKAVRGGRGEGGGGGESGVS